MTILCISMGTPTPTVFVLFFLINVLSLLVFSNPKNHVLLAGHSVSINMDVCIYCCCYIVGSKYITRYVYSFLKATYIYLHFVTKEAEH